jgi:hypothetical protein
MEPFYRAIAFWMADRTKDQLGSDPERQSHNLPQHSLMGKTAAETALIINLGVVGQANFLPDVAQKSNRICGPPLGQSLPRRITRHDIKGIETGHRFSPQQIMGHNVNLDEVMGVSRTQAGILNFWL